MGGEGAISSALSTYYCRRLLNKNLPGVHEVVDDGVNHGVCHGQPVEAKVNVLDDRVGYDVLVMVRVEEVGVVGKPADPKHHHHRDEHLHKLWAERK